MSEPVTFSLTRKRLAVLATLLVAIPVLVAGGTAWAVDSFSDVPNSHAFHDEIGWGADNGIINGFEDGTFRPGNNVSRGASAAFLSRYNDSIELVSEQRDPLSSDSWHQDVAYPSGKRPVAGGGTISTLNAFMTGSYPRTATTWRVRWESEGSAMIDPTKLEVWVLCIPLPVD
jgi:hypothetical protein